MQQLDILHESNNKKIKMTLEYDPLYPISEVARHLEFALNENTSFYSRYDNTPRDIIVTLLTYRNEYDEILGWKSSSWGSGITRGNHIYTFHPDRRAIESSHSRESFVNTLTHEICHVFSGSIFGKELWWVREGVAQYVGKQNELKKLDPESIEHFIENSLHKNIKYSEFVNNHQGHQISRRMGYAIGEVYGSETLRSLQEINPEDSEARLKVASILQATSEELDSTIRHLLTREDLRQVKYVNQQNK